MTLKFARETCNTFQSVERIKVVGETRLKGLTITVKKRLNCLKKFNGEMVIKLYEKKGEIGNLNVQVSLFYQDVSTFPQDIL